MGAYSHRSATNAIGKAGRAAGALRSNAGSLAQYNEGVCSAIEC